MREIKDTDGQILALYDFASKQEYIYKTPKIKEISGASILMAKLYDELIGELNKKYPSCYENNTKVEFDLNDFQNSSLKGSVIYNGGGNLMMIYRSYADFADANKIFSEYLVLNAPTLRLIPAFTKVTGDFIADKKALYACNTIVKNGSPPVDLPLVTPMTQIDPMTFRPVTEKGQDRLYVGEYSLSNDRVAKVKAYNNAPEKNKIPDNIEEGLIAVIFIDGNNMGNKLKAINEIEDGRDYKIGIAYLREFSEKVQKYYVDTTMEEINKKYRKSIRAVIKNGDEITLICDAEDSLDIVKTYFETLKKTPSVFPDKIAAGIKEKYPIFEENTSCAGICIAHAHTPFNLIYRLADDACESAKAQSHLNGNDNRFDFYFCHAGATTDFETLRNREQSMTGRPYEVYGELFGKDSDSVGNFDRLKPILQAAGRANVKALGNSIQLGEENFRFEVERINAYLAIYNKKHNTDHKIEYGNVEDKKLIYDMAEFYDLWFNPEKSSNIIATDGGEEE